MSSAGSCALSDLSLIHISRRNHEAEQEKGVIGYADHLVSNDKKYDGIMAYLLGRVLVIDTIDHAVVIAKKYHYSLHMVTLEGEYLSPVSYTHL